MDDRKIITRVGIIIVSTMVNFNSLINQFQEDDSKDLVDKLYFGYKRNNGIINKYIPKLIELGLAIIRGDTLLIMISSEKLVEASIKGSVFSKLKNFLNDKRKESNSYIKLLPLVVLKDFLFILFMEDIVNPFGDLIFNNFIRNNIDF